VHNAKGFTAFVLCRNGRVINMKPEGKSAVVTGAAWSLGRAIAQRFLEAGAAVIITDIYKTTLDKTIGELGLCDGIL